jgi:hypothetical protein
MRETEFLVKNLEKDISLEKIAISEFFKVNIYASKLPASIEIEVTDCDLKRIGKSVKKSLNHFDEIFSEKETEIIGYYKAPASQCSLKNKHCQKRVTIC